MASVFSAKLKGRKCLEEPLWGGEGADRDHNKGFQAAQQPAEPADDDFVVAPVCVGCDFLQQSSGPREPKSQREGRARLIRPVVLPDRNSPGQGGGEGGFRQRRVVRWPVKLRPNREGNAMTENGKGKRLYVGFEEVEKPA